TSNPSLNEQIASPGDAASGRSVQCYSLYRLLRFRKHSRPCSQHKQGPRLDLSYHLRFSQEIAHILDSGEYDFRYRDRHSLPTLRTKSSGAKQNIPQDDQDSDCTDPVCDPGSWYRRPFRHRASWPYGMEVPSLL